MVCFDFLCEGQFFFIRGRKWEIILTIDTEIENVSVWEIDFFVNPKFVFRCVSALRCGDDTNASLGMPGSSEMPSKKMSHRWLQPPHNLDPNLETNFVFSKRPGHRWESFSRRFQVACVGLWGILHKVHHPRCSCKGPLFFYTDICGSNREECLATNFSNQEWWIFSPTKRFSFKVTADPVGHYPNAFCIPRVRYRSLLFQVFWTVLLLDTKFCSYCTKPL